MKYKVKEIHATYFVPTGRLCTLLDKNLNNTLSQQAGFNVASYLVRTMFPRVQAFKRMELDVEYGHNL